MSVEIHGLTLDLSGSGGTARILRGISLDVADGESLGLVGESGSGKSMTLRCLLGIEPAGATVGGSIRVNGRDVRTLPDSELRRFRATEVAMIAQNPHAALNPVLPVRRYLAEGLVDAQGLEPGDASERATALLGEVGIADVERVLAAYPHQLSGGMLQRVVIAGALAGNPGLLLADEPTTALDVTTQAEVAAILSEERRDRGMSMIFVTHDLDLAAAVCDRLAVMRNGEIVETGTAAQLRDRPEHPYTRALMAARPLLYGKEGPRASAPPHDASR